MKPGKREALLDEFEKSGMSAAQFSRLVGMKYTSFQNWVARRRKRRASGVEVKREALHLVEAVVEGVPVQQARPALSAPGEVGLLIELSGGGRMRVDTSVQLRMAAELLAMMAQTGCGRRSRRWSLWTCAGASAGSKAW
jgi:hypothetical protein